MPLSRPTPLGGGDPSGHIWGTWEEQVRAGPHLSGLGDMAHASPQASMQAHVHMHRPSSACTQFLPHYTVHTHKDPPATPSLSWGHSPQEEQVLLGRSTRAHMHAPRRCRSDVTPASPTLARHGAEPHPRSVPGELSRGPRNSYVHQGGATRSPLPPGVAARGRPAAQQRAQKTNRKSTFPGVSLSGDKIPEPCDQPGHPAPPHS